MSHNEQSINCVCSDCWKADVADQKQRVEQPEAAQRAAERIVKTLYNCDTLQWEGGDPTVNTVVAIIRE